MADITTERKTLIEKVKSLRLNTGLSMGQIGKLTNLTRSAVTGICWRAGIKVTPRKPKPSIPKYSGGSMEAKMEKPLKSVGILELKDHHCRWIVGKGGDFDLALYCGQVKAHALTSYCAKHTKLSLAKRT